MNGKEILVFCFLRCATNRTRYLPKWDIYACKECLYKDYVYKDNTYTKNVYALRKNNIPYASSKRKYNQLFNGKSIDTIVEEIGV